MRTSWPPTKQAVLSYSLRSAFVWEINFSLRVHIFIWALLRPEGGWRRKKKKKKRQGEARAVKKHNVVTSFKSCTQQNKHRYWATKSLNMKSKGCHQTVMCSKRTPPSSVMKWKEEQMDEEEKRFSIPPLPSHCFITGVVTPTLR